MEKNPSHDGMLILLPGSRTDQGAIECLSDISGLDRYLARVKLNTKLPLPLCRCVKEDILKDAGDRLTSASIRFYGMDLGLYEAPFASLRMIQCRVDQTEIVFFDSSKNEYRLPPNKKVLLLEGVYRTNTRDELLTKTALEILAESDEKKKQRALSSDYESFRVLFLYPKDDFIPFCLVDADFDYGFLGPLKEITAAANFKVLKENIEKICSGQFNQDMVSNASILPQTATIHQPFPDLRKTKKKEKTVAPFSNVDAVNRISRLIYGQWCVEMGQMKRFLSADYNSPSG